MANSYRQLTNCEDWSRAKLTQIWLGNQPSNTNNFVKIIIEYKAYTMQALFNVVYDLFELAISLNPVPMIVCTIILKLYCIVLYFKISAIWQVIEK